MSVIKSGDKLTFANVAPVAENIMEQFALEKFDRIDLIYNHLFHLLNLIIDKHTDQNLNQLFVYSIHQQMPMQEHLQLLQILL